MLPLAICFLAVYLIGQAKISTFSLALVWQLGVSYRTALLMHSKMIQVLSEQ